MQRTSNSDASSRLFAVSSFDFISKFAMSTFYSNLSDRYHLNIDQNELNSSVQQYFTDLSDPFEDFLENLTKIIENDPNHRQKNFVCYLVQVFRQWKDESKVRIEPKHNVDQLILRQLPLNAVDDFVSIVETPKETLLNLIRSSLNLPMNSSLYKRAVHLLVRWDFQTEFQARELLLPWIISSKEHLIDIYLNEKRQYEEYLLEILNHLYEENGKKISEILKKDFGMTDVKIAKKTLAKLAVRYWNLLGHDQVEKYPKLATLQAKRTLGYLINLKYKNGNEEKTMSDECWNELIEVKDRRRFHFIFTSFVQDICQGHADLSEHLIEALADKDDPDAVRYWSKALINGSSCHLILI